MMRIDRSKIVSNQRLGRLLAVTLLGATALVGAAQADVQSGVVKYEAGNFSGAIKDWLPLASENDPNALFNLGQVYRLGRGVAKDMPTARNYYERAARLGHVSAQGNLGTLYFFADDGALKDQEKAVSWWQEAATNGDARSQYMLGVLFFNGEVVDRDWTRAYAWMGLAASAGLPEASQAETSMLKHMTAAQVADAREISLTLVNPAGAFPNSMPIQFAKPSAPIQPAKATPISAGVPASKGSVVSIDASANKPAVVSVQQVADSAPETDLKAAEMPKELGTVAMEAASQAADIAALADQEVQEVANRVDVAAADIVVPPEETQPAAQDSATDAMSAAVDDMPTALSYSYKLQLAAFSTQDKASSAWGTFSAKHSDVLSSLSPDVVAADLGARGTLYRLYANGFETKASARDACSQLKAAGQGCLVVNAQ